MIGRILSYFARRHDVDGKFVDGDENASRRFEKIQIPKSVPYRVADGNLIRHLNIDTRELLREVNERRESGGLIRISTISYDFV